MKRTYPLPDAKYVIEYTVENKSGIDAIAFINQVGLFAEESPCSVTYNGAAFRLYRLADESFKETEPFAGLPE